MRNKMALQLAVGIVKSLHSFQTEMLGSFIVWPQLYQRCLVVRGVVTEQCCHFIVTWNVELHEDVCETTVLHVVVSSGPSIRKKTNIF